MNKTVFNAYVRYMRKAAHAFNHGNSLMCKNSRRHSYWCHQYLKYAKRAVKLAWQMPQEHRINFERFLIYDQTKNMIAFTGTLEQARNL